MSTVDQLMKFGTGSVASVTTEEKRCIEYNRRKSSGIITVEKKDVGASIILNQLYPFNIHHIPIQNLESVGN